MIKNNKTLYIGNEVAIQLSFYIENSSVNLIFEFKSELNCSAIFLDKKKLKIDIQSQVVKTIVSLEEVNIFTNIFTVLLGEKSNNFELSSFFEIDKKLIENEKYLNKTFFSPNSRSFLITDGFLIIWSILNTLSNEHPSYPGFLTLMSYRYAEDFQNKEYIGRYIVQKRLSLIENINNEIENLTRVRWLVSSGFTTAIISYSLNDITSAIKLLNDVRKFEYAIEKLPKIAMNYYSAALLLAMIYYENGNNLEANMQSEGIFYGTKKSISYIYSLENKAVLSQISDCKMLLEIGSDSLILSKATTNSLNTRKAPRNKFMYEKVLSRFDKTFVQYLNFNAINQKIQNEYLK